MTSSSKEILVSHPARYVAYLLYMSLCVFSTLDTGLFVYPSLSRYLLLEVGILILGFVCVSACIMAGKRVLASRYSFFILGWIIYVSLHALFTHPHEIYRALYLNVILSLLLVLDAGQRTGLLARKSMEDGLMLVAAIHIVFMAAQKFGMAESANVYFPVVGSNDNPTATALYFVGVMPILISRARQSGWHYTNVAFVFLVMVGILVLRCRTAYIGLCIEAAVYAVMCHRETLRKVAGRHPLVILVAAAVITGAGFRMYSMKKDSADGRLLIWQQSVEMIADKPLGYGYGLFEKNYNLHQAEYFSRGDFSDTERRTADFVYMPYNDYIEQGVEGGVVGMAFLAAFYFLFISKAVRERRIMEAAILTAFSVMSLTNFVYTSIQPWMLVICCAAFAMSDDGTEVHPPQRRDYTANVLVTVLLLVAAYFTAGLTMAQLKLKELDTCMENGADIPDRQFDAIEEPVATSEAYWRIRAKNCMSLCRHGNALTFIRRARQYSSSPELLGMEAECLRRNEKPEAAMRLMDTLSCMLPHVLRLKLILMRHNASQGKEEDALRYAGDIIATGAKYDTEEARMIIREAEKYKKTESISTKRMKLTK